MQFRISTSWTGVGLALIALSNPAAAQEKPKQTKPAEPGPLAFVYSTDQKIRFFQDRIKRDPTDHTNYTHLGELYAQKARESGDLSYFPRAEKSLRKALEMFPHDSQPKLALAVVLCDQHKFTEGLALVKEVIATEPKNIDALATLGDAHLELGNYAEAEKAYAALKSRTHSEPPILARLARLAELKGDLKTAVQLIEQAAQHERDNGESPAAAIWYVGRLGDLAFGMGRLEEAAKHYEAALKLKADFEPGLHGLGRVRAAQGRFDDALALFKKALATGEQPDVLADLGAVYLLMGDKTKADQFFARVEEKAGKQEEYRRFLAMFYADLDRKLPEALELAQKEFANRKDFYGCDVLAWTLFKNNRLKEAAQASNQALALGTRDAAFHFHAGMIQYRLGNKEKARQHLEEALGINPQFSLRHAAEARRLAAELAGKVRNP